MTKIVLIDHDCELLDSVTRGLLKRNYNVEQICKGAKVDLLMEMVISMYGHDPKMPVLVISDYHLPGIKGIEILHYARDVGSHRKFRSLSLAIMSNDCSIHRLPGLAKIPIIPKDQGFQNMMNFLEALITQQRI